MCDYCRGYDGLDAAEGGPDEILIRWMLNGYPVIIVDHPNDNYGSWSIPISFCPFCGRKLEKVRTDVD